MTRIQKHVVSIQAEVENTVRRISDCDIQIAGALLNLVTRRLELAIAGLRLAEWSIVLRIYIFSQF